MGYLLANGGMSNMSVTCTKTGEITLICYTAHAVNEILTVSETARFLKKHPHTIRRWIIDKKLPAKKIASGGSGVFAILKSDLLEFVLKYMEKAKKEEKKIPVHDIPPGQKMLPM